MVLTFLLFHRTTVCPYTFPLCCYFSVWEETFGGMWSLQTLYTSMVLLCFGHLLSGHNSELFWVIHDRGGSRGLRVLRCTDQQGVNPLYKHYILFWPKYALESRVRSFFSSFPFLLYVCTSECWPASALGWGGSSLANGEDAQWFEQISVLTGCVNMEVSLMCGFTRA